MFHPAAQLVCWTQNQEDVIGDKFSNARARKEKTQNAKVVNFYFTLNS